MIKELLQKTYLMSVLALGAIASDAKADEQEPVSVQTAAMGDVSVAATHNFHLKSNPAGTAFDTSKGGLTISGGANSIKTNIDSLTRNFSILQNMGEVETIEDISDELNSLDESEIAINVNPYLFLQLNVNPGYSGTISVGSISEAQFHLDFNPLSSNDLELDLLNQQLLVNKNGNLLEYSFKADLGVQIAYAFPIPIGPVTVGTAIKTRHFKRIVKTFEIEYPENIGVNVSTEDLGVDDIKEPKDLLNDFQTADGFGLDLATLVNINDPLFNTNVGVVCNNVISHLKTETGLMQDEFYVDSGLSIHPLYWMLQLPSKNQEKHIKAMNILSLDKWEFAMDWKNVGTDYFMFGLGAQFPILNGIVIPKVGYMESNEVKTFTTGLSLQTPIVQLDFAYWKNEVDTYLLALTFGGGLKQ